MVLRQDPYLREFLQLEPETEKRKKAEVSHYETILYATTHSLTKTWDKFTHNTVKHCLFEPATETLTFEKPLTSDAEIDYQKYFTEEILTQLDDGSVKAVDSHQLIFLNGKASNIATHTKGYSLNSHTVEAIGEIKCQGSCFTKNNLGRVRPYTITLWLWDSCQIVMTSYLFRQGKWITGLRVDLDDVIAFTQISTVFSIIDNENVPPIFIQPQDVLFMLVRSLYLHLHEKEDLRLSKTSDVLEFCEKVFSDKLWEGYVFPVKTWNMVP
ncbi:4462_t:CDS:2 [Diversispora eburnea]|uniref:4462_t:CDS:1 n=1 Tax=Diversispora eburnea TaxID=1213867 RepID=A0A9N9BTA3_9GLOM|nr:4462_t:CDS:2 [Diversispora eburnea]